MSPLMITASPTAARSGPDVDAVGTTPIPAVLMKTPSPLPVSTTLVSPVTSRTPAARAAAPMASATRPMLGQRGAFLAG